MLPTDTVLLKSEYERFRIDELRATDVENEIAVPVETSDEIEPENTVSAEVPENATVIPSNEIEIDEEHNALIERRLTLSERLRRVEAGYIKLKDKELRKLQEELAEVDAQLQAKTNTQPPSGDVIEEEVVRVIDSEPIPSKSEDGYKQDQYRFEMVDRNYPSTPCAVEKERDAFNNKLRAYVAPTYFFHFTPEQMRIQLKGKHYMDAHASIAKINDQLVLRMMYEIRTANRRSSYGKLEAGSRISFKLSNGEQVPLYHVGDEAGSYDEVNNIYRYEGRYLIDKDAEKQLSKHYVDGARVFWSVGFEDYTIYQVDCLQNQLKCLLNSL